MKSRLAQYQWKLQYRFGIESFWSSLTQQGHRWALACSTAFSELDVKVRDSQRAVFLMKVSYLSFVSMEQEVRPILRRRHRQTLQLYQGVVARTLPGQ